MCGINGLVFLKGVKRDEAMMAKIRFIFDELMVETQDRGEHATGISSFRRDGSYELHKKDFNADFMTTYDSAYRNIVDNFDAEETSVVIAHTRYLTKGKADNMDNNHPFDIGNVVGLHNGSAKNDDALFTKYKDKFDRIGEVDSEIVFQLINHYNADDITVPGLRSALEKTRLKGLFALAFVHKSNSNLLHLVKQEKPMVVGYWKEAGVFIFNSMESYIDKAFRKLERAGATLGLIDAEQTVDVVKVADDSYFTINADAVTPEGAITKEIKMYLETSTYVYTPNTAYSKSKSGTTTKTGSTTTYTPKYTPVTATDANGLTLYGEVDEHTGEVVLWKDDDARIPKKDKASEISELLKEEEELCYECQAWLSEDDAQASFNQGNPKNERVCTSCYIDTMAMAIENQGVKV